jgi:3'-5' exoribonuclease
MTHKPLSEVNVGDTLKQAFVARDSRVRVARNNTKFLQATLADRSGQLEARWWDVDDEAAFSVPPGEVCIASCKVEEYQGKMNLVITAARPAGEDEYDAEDLVPCTEFSVEELKEELSGLVASIEDEDLRRFLVALFEDKFLEKFCVAPAARDVHHAFRGGLLEHSVMIARMANLICQGEPKLNRDLLVSGALIHDVGKVFEISGGMDREYTVPGRLLGHVYMGCSKADKVMSSLEGFPSMKRLKLLHMILSHHGTKEAGAPVLPHCPEAFALSYLDGLNSKTELSRRLIDTDRGEGPFAEWNKWVGVQLFKE